MIQDRAAFAYSSLNSTLSSIRANLMDSGIRSRASHRAIVRLLTPNFFASSFWTSPKLRRPAFISNPVMFPAWQKTYVIVNLSSTRPICQIKSGEYRLRTWVGTFVLSLLFLSMLFLPLCITARASGSLHSSAGPSDQDVEGR